MKYYLLIMGNIFFITTALASSYEASFSSYGASSSSYETSISLTNSSFEKQKSRNKKALAACVCFSGVLSTAATVSAVAIAGSSFYVPAAVLLPISVTAICGLTGKLLCKYSQSIESNEDSVTNTYTYIYYVDHSSLVDKVDDPIYKEFVERERFQYGESDSSNS